MKFIELPTGQWINPKHIVLVTPEDRDIRSVSRTNTPQVTVHCSGTDNIRIPCETFEEAQTLARTLADLINAERRDAH
jgi:hypothetical protein